MRGSVHPDSNFKLKLPDSLENIIIELMDGP
jgi:hypothetical protein